MDLNEGNKTEKSFKVDPNKLIFISILVIMGIILLGGYFAESTIPTMSSKPNISKNRDKFSDTMELHWDHMPLTYTFQEKDKIYPLRIERINLALREIGKLTNNSIQFIEVSKDADITFIGTKSMKIEREEYSSLDYFLMGEDEGYSPGTQTLGEATWNVEGNIIYNAEIFFYGGIKENCLDYPAVEMHEILHVFGMEHSKNVASVMSKMEHYCIQKIRQDVDGDIFSCLKDIYFNGEFNGNCSKVNLLTGDDLYGYACEDNWYRVEGTEYCCPEPNMIIDNEGYCSFA